MNNYKMIISYDGTRYYGWEHQPNTDMTIQGKLECVLSQMVNEAVEVIGAGRTDAGVHAKGMVANVHMNTDMTEEQICDYMNKYLPEDICVQEVRIASERFHSRYNAMGKTYCYTCYVGDKKPVFNRKYVHITGKMPDVEAMKKAAVREIYSIDIALKGSYLNMTYHGSGFLQYMVRILSGTLLEVGFHKRTPESMTELLDAKNRALAGATAPAKGLSLLKVHYAR